MLHRLRRLMRSDAPGRSLRGRSGGLRHARARSPPPRPARGRRRCSTGRPASRERRRARSASAGSPAETAPARGAREHGTTSNARRRLLPCQSTRAAAEGWWKLRHGMAKRMWRAHPPPRDDAFLCCVGRSAPRDARSSAHSHVEAFHLNTTTPTTGIGIQRARRRTPVRDSTGCESPATEWSNGQPTAG